MKSDKVRIGQALSWALVVLLAIDTGTAVANRTCDPLQWTCHGDPHRVEALKQLEHTQGKHLVVVRYEKRHNVHDEWVYNGADIDGAKVLWARELSPEQNAKLFAYFKDRKIWLIDPDLISVKLSPYSALPAKPTGTDEEADDDDDDGDKDDQ